MKKILSSILIVCLLTVLPMALTACKGVTNLKSVPTLRVYNWADYMDPSLIPDFETKYNCKIVLSTFDSNESMFANLSIAGSNQDVVFPSDYTIGKMIDKDMLEKLDFSKIPNSVNIDPRFSTKMFDPNGQYSQYSVPYFWGTVGILYNKKKVTDPVNSWNIIFDKKYQKGVIMIDSARDIAVAPLKKLGFSVNETNADHLNQAKALLLKQKSDGIVFGYYLDEAKEKMVNGEAAMAVVYSGVGMLAIQENSDLAYALPNEGSNVWLDAAVILKSSKQKDLAYKFLNYLSDVQVAKKNAEYIQYSTPNKEAFKLLDSETQNNPVLYPSDDFLKEHDFEVFLNLAPEYEKLYANMLDEVTSK